MKWRAIKEGIDLIKYEREMDLEGLGESVSCVETASVSKKIDVTVNATRALYSKVIRESRFTVGQ